MTTTQQLAGITAQHNEIVKRVCNGSLDADSVRRGLQGIIEGRAASASQANVPVWYVSPERQLELARQLWPAVPLPEIPPQFTPRTETEVLLLHVPASFDALWAAVNPPAGYTKWRSDHFTDDLRSLRLAPNFPDRRIALVWRGFDPEYGRGQRPDKLWGQSNLAASEVLSALIQFPDWCLSWFNGASAPNLSGYQMKYGADWSFVPCVRRWDDDRQLRLGAYCAGHGSPKWASPSVREC